MNLKNLKIGQSLIIAKKASLKPGEVKPSKKGGFNAKNKHGILRQFTTKEAAQEWAKNTDVKE